MDWMCTKETISNLTRQAFDMTARGKPENSRQRDTWKRNLSKEKYIRTFSEVK